MRNRKKSALIVEARTLNCHPQKDNKSELLTCWRRKEMAVARAAEMWYKYLQQNLSSPFTTTKANMRIPPKQPWRVPSHLSCESSAINLLREKKWHSCQFAFANPGFWVSWWVYCDCHHLTIEIPHYFSPARRQCTVYTVKIAEVFHFMW